MNKSKSTKGITLVALIITIIVLLILAVVAIGAVNDGGIIGHAQNAKTKFEIEQEKEGVYLAVNQAVLVGNGKIIENNLTKALNSQFGEENTKWQYSEKTSEYLEVQIMNSGRKYKVYLNGTIEGPIGGTGGTPPTPVVPDNLEITVEEPVVVDSNGEIKSEAESVTSGKLYIQFKPTLDGGVIDSVTIGETGVTAETDGTYKYEVTENGTYEFIVQGTANGKTYNKTVSIEVNQFKKSDMPIATVGVKTTENSTIDGNGYSSSNPIIPAGFAPINITGTHASSWDAEGGPQVNNGLVITSDPTPNTYGTTVGNEFVWIPVPEAEFSSFAVPKSTGSTDYKGVLDTTKTTYKEPADLTSTTKWKKSKTLWNGKSVKVYKEYTYDGTDMFELFDMPGTYSNRYYQDKFNSMVASVAKYGGFYVGRYETSLSENDIAQSKMGQPLMNNMEWYRMYTYSEAYSPSGVKTEMIWGCQWDAMMRFIGSKATENRHVSHNLSSPYSTGGTDYTGSVEYADIANNIYDLEGNVYERTQEAFSPSGRSPRGGSYLSGNSPSTRFGSIDYPTTVTISLGSRLTLYVELPNDIND